MGFWGIEVKPGKPHPYHSDNVRGKLHITQATLGLGSTTERSILQCSIGHKSPIFLCSLLPNKNESCSLNLEFDEDDDVVAFSVIGQQSIHLSGYFVAEDGDHLRDEYESDSYGEDDDVNESEESSDYDTEDGYNHIFVSDDDDLFHPSSVRKSGVVIEEIVDDEKPTNGKDGSKNIKKKKKSGDSEDKNNSQAQLVSGGTGAPVLVSEDEDGFPISASHENKATFEPEGSDKKRKVKSTDEDSQLERKKKKKNQKEKGTDNNTNDLSEDTIQPEEIKSHDRSQVSPVENQDDKKLSNNKVVDTDANSKNPSETKKKKNKKKKNQDTEKVTDGNQTVGASGDKSSSTLKSEEKKAAGKPYQTRTFSNGLVIEELAMGKPDGKRASRGKKVSVCYTGKLKKNGKIFDSNVGRAPFKFRLGVGQVIKGWDVGVEGMRIGDKRRLTIPPSMGYGPKGAGREIPPNSWLEFEVELVDVS